MKYYVYISCLFLLSCSAKKWEFSDCRDCDSDKNLKTYYSPNDDYSISVITEWVPHYQSDDSSNVVFDIDYDNLPSSENDTNNMYVLGIVRYNTGIYSSPEKEHQRNLQNLLRDNPTIEVIESGKTDLLGAEAYYLHTREKVPNKAENIDLYFQVRNENDSNYYILQIRAPANGKEKYNLCLMVEMLKTFKLK